MGKSIQVEKQQLRDAAKKDSGYADTIKEIYKSLLQQASTMGEAYQSSDNEAFVQKINGVATKLNQMVEKLRSGRDNLNTQAKNYEDRRQDNINQVNNLGD